MRANNHEQKLDTDENSLIHQLAISGDVARFQNLKLLNEPDFLKRVNSPNKLGKTPLHLAILNKQFKFADALLHAGADLCKKDKKGLTILHCRPPA